MSDRVRKLEDVELFAHLVYGDFKPDTCGLMYLASRKKYDPDGFSRVTFHDSRGFINAVRRTSGSAPYDKTTGEPMSLESLVTYAVLNPRDLKKAHYEFFTRRYDPARDGNAGLSDSSYRDLIHKHVANTEFMDLDIDTKDPEILAQLSPLVDDLGDHVVAKIETHGGFHVIVRVSDMDRDDRSVLLRPFYDPKWRSGEKKLVEVHRDGAAPVPGTVQGGTWVVRFVDRLVSGPEH